jgi:hypothetical protein
MNEQEPGNVRDPREQESTPEISVNQYGSTKDPAVVVDEASRTVLLTPDETIVIEKEPEIDIVPKNRPRSVYAGMWGNSEIASVAIGIFAVLAVVFIYVFLVVPSNSEVARHASEVDRLSSDQQEANQNFGNSQNIESRVADIVSSEENFEALYLPPEASGRNALYQRLNGLIDAYGLENTSGPDYTPLVPVDQQNDRSSDEERGRDRFRSVFPGMYVSMTVEGSYQNLRRFINDIEAGREFVIISSVQLEPSDNQRSQQQNQSTAVQQPQQTQPQVQTYPGFSGRFPANPNPVPQGPVAVPQKGKTRGELVSLHLEMAAYFRRPTFEPAAAQ